MNCYLGLLIGIIIFATLTSTYIHNAHKSGVIDPDNRVNICTECYYIPT